MIGIPQNNVHALLGKQDFLYVHQLAEIWFEILMISDIKKS